MNDETPGDEITMMMVTYPCKQNNAQALLKDQETLNEVHTLRWLIINSWKPSSLNHVTSNLLKRLWRMTFLFSYEMQNAMPNALKHEMQCPKLVSRRGGQILRCYSCPYSIHCEPVDTK